MDDMGTRVGNLKLTGGALCLDFANTVDSRGRADSLEYLNNYADLVAWGRHAGVLAANQETGLLIAAAARPAEAAAVLARAREVREAIFRLFAALADGQPAGAGDLDVLNSALVDAAAHARLAPAATGFVWIWVAVEESLDSVLWPVLRSAADLLTSVDLARVHECEGVGCGWLFVDTSRNGRRRWCTMEGCGNRAKAQRYYRRRRGGSDAADDPQLHLATDF